ncbi:MFS transporter [Acaryochloris sp. IP29b_bin.137]|uniref:MFS transporter n=1 Tax=Acaryochloris sp. IP29b_bin.137 TaxID=2969217 RepID=UPI0026159CD9|nr:MFS transporter [Acaryochloris sp. IP29b_bin.137]
MSQKLHKPHQSPQINHTVKALGVVSLLTDLSTKMVYPITPIFLTQILGAPIWTLGLIEGIAESTASLLKLYSGWLSDRVGRRKPFALLGYGLGACSRILMAVSMVWGHVLGARFIDRLGKGLRAAPRDVLITENSPPHKRGYAFGLHHSLEKVGEVLGPLLGAIFLWFFPGNYRGVFAIAVIPAFLGIAVLSVVVRERRTKHHSNRAHPQLKWRGLSHTYRHFLMVMGLFSVGNSSDTFLLLRAQDLGLPSSQILLLYALLNLVEVLLGVAAGRLSDRVGRKALLRGGFLIFAVVYLGFALTTSIWVVWILFLLYGLYSTFTRGVQKALVSDLVHPERRGAEIGVFHTVTGAAALPASLIAGALYSQIDSGAPFYFSALIAVITVLLLELNKDIA